MINIVRALWIARFLYYPFWQQEPWPVFSKGKDSEFLMGKMLAFLIILRKNISIIKIQICTLGARSFTTLQWCLSYLLRLQIFHCVKQTPVGFWHSAPLNCGNLKDFHGTKPQSYPSLISCLLHIEYFSSSPKAPAASLVIFWWWLPNQWE